MHLKIVSNIENKELEIEWLRATTITKTCSDDEWLKLFGSSTGVSDISIFEGHQSLATVLELQSEITFSVQGVEKKQKAGPRNLVRKRLSPD